MSMWGKKRLSLGGPFITSLLPFPRAPHSWPNHLLTPSLGAFEHRNLGKSIIFIKVTFPGLKNIVKIVKKRKLENYKGRKFCTIQLILMAYVYWVHFYFFKKERAATDQSNNSVQSSLAQ